MATEPTPDQVNRALNQIEEGETVTVTMKDGRQITGLFGHTDGDAVVTSDEDGTLGIDADQVTGLSIRDSTEGPE
jgi:hypothetical protein